ncbi:MAG TPA: SPFH domain-containing protein [Edaphocola sp.]|nr:SPFH domain-containing protein [Edaphocola sp.]
MEKIKNPMSGYLALLLVLGIIGYAIYNITQIVSSPIAPSGWSVFMVILLFFVAFFILKGLIIVEPNHSRVMNFFGKYVGTVKENGLFFVNPLYTTIKISLRADNLHGDILKVNDKMGNPIEIGTVIVWQVKDTYKAAYEVSSYMSFVKIQSEAAVRHLAGSFPYDNLEDENAEITLREGGDEVNHILEKELTERLAQAGVEIVEARISHLAYAPEIAGAMLQRQQATAIVAARMKIVEGAVGMVELALEKLSEKKLVELDSEKKATMVSNLMVVLCAEKSPSPVVNTGTLYQ